MRMLMLLFDPEENAPATRPFRPSPNRRMIPSKHRNRTSLHRTCLPQRSPPDRGRGVAALRWDQAANRDDADLAEGDGDRAPRRNTCLAPRSGGCGGCRGAPEPRGASRDCRRSRPGKRPTSATVATLIRRSIRIRRTITPPGPRRSAIIRRAPHWALSARTSRRKAGPSDTSVSAT